jgi:hypothetical protein
MARKRKRLGVSTHEVDPPASASDQDDPENPGPTGRFREMFWFPERDRAMREMVASAESAPAEVSRLLREATKRGTPGERFSALMSRLANMLTARDQAVRQSAARFLEHAFVPLSDPLLACGSSIPEELAQALPAMLEALSTPDSDMRLSLLDSLRHLTSRHASASILPSITEHLLTDSVAEVILQALNVVMATGVDRAFVTIPAILNLLRHEEARVRLSACEALAKFGPEASPAVPELVHIICSDGTPSVQKQAVRTVAAVDWTSPRMVSAQ